MDNKKYFDKVYFLSVKYVEISLKQEAAVLHAKGDGLLEVFVHCADWMGTLM